MNGALQVFHEAVAHVEVRMQNLVTVVEILTKDVFLCQSQGEDACLCRIGGVNTRMCTEGFVGQGALFDG